MVGTSKYRPPVTKKPSTKLLRRILEGRTALHGVGGTDLVVGIVKNAEAGSAVYKSSYVELCVDLTGVQTAVKGSVRNSHGHVRNFARQFEGWTEACGRQTSVSVSVLSYPFGSEEPVVPSSETCGKQRLSCLGITAR